jgi:prepilin-type N-terminal cleavage/methylation domain-containing protein
MSLLSQGVVRVVLKSCAARGALSDQAAGGMPSPVPRNHAARASGFSLAECLCAVALMATLSVLALPSLESLAQRMRVDMTRDRWLSDLDLARSWSARHGLVSALSRRTDCPGLADARDWRCGWQVIVVNSAQVLQESPLTGELSVLYSTTTGELRVAASGDPMTAGASLRIKPWRSEWVSLATTICLNIAGRVHWQPGEGCA